MRNRFARAFCGLAAGVAVTTTLGLMGAGAASAATHHAKPDATTACGVDCFDISSLLLGTGTILNAYVPGDTGAGGKVGQMFTLKFASNSHPNEDFTEGFIGFVDDFCGSTPGFSDTSYVCLNYGDYPVYEFDWSAFGNQSGLCAGVASALQGESVTLQTCGTTVNTLWIADVADGVTSNDNDYDPFINGADTAFSHPLVLTVDAGTAHPENQVKIERENLLSGDIAEDAQEFTSVTGPAS